MNLSCRSAVRGGLVALGLLQLVASGCGMGIPTGDCFSDNCDCLPGGFCTLSGERKVLAFTGGETLSLKGYGLDPSTGTIWIDNQECTGVSTIYGDPNITIGDPPVMEPNTYTCTTPAFHGPGPRLLRMRNGGNFSAERWVDVVGVPWGNGVDGHLTVSGSLSVMTAPSGHGRTMVQYERITGIDATNPHKITVDAGMSLAAGDEILWHVSAASSQDACGASDLKRGYFGTSYIRAISGTTLYLDREITAYPHQINTANLASTDTGVGGAFCVIQVVRVPNLQSLSNPAGSVTTSSSFAYSPGVGGILPIRVAATWAPASASFIVADTVGFAGGSGSGGKAGDGAAGASPLTARSTRNLSGAGGSTTGAGAGGGGGLMGTSPSAAGGDGAIAEGGTYSSETCDREDCFLFGGGGGASDTATAGGNGGGAVLVWARTLAHSGGTASVTATGGSGTSVNGGGGGGGAVLLSVLESVGNWANLTVNVSGGANGGAGGGGAGGVARILQCTGSPAAVVTNVSAGGGGAAAGTEVEAQGGPCP